MSVLSCMKLIMSGAANSLSIDLETLRLVFKLKENKDNNLKQRYYYMSLLIYRYLCKLLTPFHVNVNCYQSYNSHEVLAITIDFISKPPVNRPSVSHWTRDQLNGYVEKLIMYGLLFTRYTIIISIKPPKNPLQLHRYLDFFKLKLSNYQCINAY